jgi:hypothetical protein
VNISSGLLSATTLISMDHVMFLIADRQESISKMLTIIVHLVIRTVSVSYDKGKIKFANCMPIVKCFTFLTSGVTSMFKPHPVDSMN